MSKSWKRLGKSVGVYGAALAGLAGARAAEGAVVNLSPNPGSIPFSSTTSGPGSAVSLGFGLSFAASNNSSWRSLWDGNLSFRQTTAGNQIKTSMSFTSYVSFTLSATKTTSVAFRTSSNQVGWIRLHLGGPGGAITFDGAAYETTPGTSILAGETAPTPEPGTAALFGLGLLALGAAGIRKMRKKAAAAS